MGLVQLEPELILFIEIVVLVPGTQDVRVVTVYKIFTHHNNSTCLCTI